VALGEGKAGERSRRKPSFVRLPRAGGWALIGERPCTFISAIYTLSRHEDAEWVARRIGEDVQRLVGIISAVENDSRPRACC